MKRVAPIRWFGGKNSLAPWIVSHLPPHDVYVEVFGGAMSVLLHKQPSPLEVYNDLDQSVVNFWRVVRDPLMFADLQLRLELTPYARAERWWSRETRNETPDPVERAARWWTFISQTFSADMVGGWSYDVKPVRGAVRSYLSRIDCLPDVHARLRSVQIENDTWQAILDRYDGEGVLFYMDPPYVHESRSRPDHGYAIEMTNTEHQELIDRLLGIRGQVILSGYSHPIYEALESAGWRKYECDVLAPSSPSGRTKLKQELPAERRSEVLWIRATRPVMPLYAEVI